MNATTLTLRSGRRSALLVGGLAAVIGLSLALLLALGTPWRGPISVSGQPIDCRRARRTSATFTPTQPARQGRRLSPGMAAHVGLGQEDGSPISAPRLASASVRAR